MTSLIPAQDYRPGNQASTKQVHVKYLNRDQDSIRCHEHILKLKGAQKGKMSVKNTVKLVITDS